VVEGQAVEVGDAAELEHVANAYESKYGVHFTAPEGTWFGLSDAIRAGKVLLCRVTPTTVLGFGKGEQFSQTRWRFARVGEDELPRAGSAAYPGGALSLTRWATSPSPDLDGATPAQVLARRGGIARVLEAAEALTPDAW
jgi:Protein of unknown function (DUF2384)